MSETEFYATNMHEYVLLDLPVEPLPPLRTEREFRWYHVGIIAASFFALGVIVYTLAFST